MFILVKDNVERVVATENEKIKLEAKGFRLLFLEKEVKSNLSAKKVKKDESLKALEE